MATPKPRQSRPTSETPWKRSSRNHALPNPDASSDGTPSAPASLLPGDDITGVIDSCYSSNWKTPDPEHIIVVQQEVDDGVANEITTPTIQDIREYPEISHSVERRKIYVTGQELSVLTDLVLSAIVASNNPPRLFVRGRSLVRIVVDTQRNPIIETFTEAGIRGYLSRGVSFIKLSRDYQEIPISAPKEIVQDLMTQPGWSQLPSLAGFTECPIINLTTGKVTTTPGYDPETQLYYQPPAGFTLPAISDSPTQYDVEQAVNRITEIFADFPFDGKASRTNAIGMLISVVLRSSISGSVPMALVSKPQRGTGATLIARYIHMVATGRDAPMTPTPGNESEWNKTITSIVGSGCAIVVFDNVNHKLDSPSLAAFLTSTGWRNRLLGSNNSPVLSSEQITVIATGNNISVASDIARRCIPIRLNSQIAQPWTRQETEFRHPNLLQWIHIERARILAAIFTIARAWVLAGKPKPVTDDPRMGGFETWQDTIGGILAIAGLIDFLDNLQEVHEDLDSETHQDEAFIAKWYSLWGSDDVTVAQVANHIAEEELKLSHLDVTRDRLVDVLPDELADAWVRKQSFNVKLGNWLSRQKDRVFKNGLTLTKNKTKHTAKTWIIQPKSNDLKGQCDLIQLREREVG